MAEVTRRSLLIQASAAGAVAAGVAAVPVLREANGGSGRGTPAAVLPDHVVVHVRDAATGEVAVLAGTAEVVTHDLELVARIAGLVPRTAKR
jgi:hypothetical protein